MLGSDSTPGQSKPAKTIMRIRRVDFAWHELSPNALNNYGVVAAFWTPVLVVYFKGVQIWYTLFSTLYRVLVGTFDHIRKIRSSGMLRSLFLNMSALNIVSRTEKKFPSLLQLLEKFSKVLEAILLRNLVSPPYFFPLSSQTPWMLIIMVAVHVLEAKGMIDRMDRQSENHEGTANTSVANPDRVKFTEFRKMNLPSFKGTLNHDKADDWIKAIEKVFGIIECDEEKKETYVAYMLEADAEFWWMGARRLLETEGNHITWEVFKEAFYEKYVPQSVRDAKEAEFLHLQQGTMSVVEYTAKFEQLCKYSEIYQKCPDEAWKCRRYQGGLREDLLAIVGPMEPKDFARLVNKSRLSEECNRKLATAKTEAFRRRMAPQGIPFKPKFMKKPFHQRG
ncbi:hypothetical protein VNO77_08020 [Canavalia gladiata]|uniref:Retrotransposon gag domain-containing protein n=1 Tax=Canavalia gladiata TaxID=3824 RepID=A0AAN9M8W3_CANGL